MTKRGGKPPDVETGVLEFEFAGPDGEWQERARRNATEQFAPM
jgi:hypothetical protein